METGRLLRLGKDRDQGEEGEHHGDSPKGSFAGLVGVALASLKNGDKSLDGVFPGLNRRLLELKRTLAGKHD